MLAPKPLQSWGRSLHASLHMRPHASTSCPCATLRLALSWLALSCLAPPFPVPPWLVPSYCLPLLAASPPPDHTRPALLAASRRRCQPCNARGQG